MLEPFRSASLLKRDSTQVFSQIFIEHFQWLLLKSIFYCFPMCRYSVFFHSNCVCVCVFVCVFIFFHRKGFSRLKKTIDLMPEFRSGMVCSGNAFVSRTFVSLSTAIVEKIFKLATVQKSVHQNEQNHEKLRAALKKFLKNQRQKRVAQLPSSQLSQAPSSLSTKTILQNRNYNERGHILLRRLSQYCLISIDSGLDITAEQICLT